MKLIISKDCYTLQVKGRDKVKYYFFDNNGNYIDKCEVKTIKRLKSLIKIGCKGET